MDPIYIYIRTHHKSYNIGTYVCPYLRNSFIAYITVSREPSYFRYISLYPFMCFIVIAIAYLRNKPSGIFLHIIHIMIAIHTTVNLNLLLTYVLE